MGNAGGKPVRRVTIGAHTYRSTVAVYGGDFMLPLSAANREAAVVAAGDTRPAPRGPCRVVGAVNLFAARLT